MQQASTDPRPAGSFPPGLMFALSILFLLFLAGLVYTHPPDAERSGEDLPAPLDWDAIELQIQLGGMAVLWPIFVVEALLRFFRRDRAEGFWRPLRTALLVCLVPPLRLGVKAPPPGREIWLPRLGWRPVDRDLRKQLERFFSVPMILMALMVLPLLAIEFGASRWVNLNDYDALRRFLEIGNSVIWLAFAIEFLVMVCVAPSKLTYCVQNWVNLVIILLPPVYIMLMVLPQVQFVPLLRLVSMLRLNQLTRMGRVYRLQGLALRAWRAFLVLEVVQRISGRSLEKRLRQLEQLLAAKEEEVVELRQEIEDLKKRIAAEKARQEALLSAAFQQRWRP